MTIRRRQHDAGPAFRAAVDILVYAPLGFGALLIEDAPRAVEQVRQELSNARFVGRFTVDQGVAQMRKRRDATSEMVAESVAETVDRGPLVTVPVRTESVQESPDAESRPGVGASVPPSVDSLPSVADLALPDYDTLPAIDIVAKLEALDIEERAAIERFESAHRQRRTILGKLAQLSVQGSTG